jgi:hypothetical protein
MIHLFAHHPAPPLPTFLPSLGYRAKILRWFCVLYNRLAQKPQHPQHDGDCHAYMGLGDFCYAPPPVFILVFWLLGFGFNPEVLYCIQNVFITALLHKTLFVLQRWQKHKKAFSRVFKHTICCWWCLWSGSLFLSSWIWTYLHYFWGIW